MSVPSETNVEKLQARFEGREAIYIEKGAVYVRVRNIRWDHSIRCITATVEEIITVGFPAGVFCDAEWDEINPRSWNIGAGYLTTFSDHTWSMGYGGWDIYFAPEIVDGILRLAREFPTDLHPFQKYREILKYLDDHNAHKFVQKVLP